MLEIKGKYATATVYTNIIEESAKEQIKLLCDQSFTERCSIKIMSDVHSGKGCVIGFTADLKEKVIPNIVGVDIGCGMLTIELGKDELLLDKVDQAIRKYVPSGFDIHNKPTIEFKEINDLYCFHNLTNINRILSSLGTLGGGNHFIEIDVDDENNKYLVIHTGSRNLGKQVADYYQDIAVESLKGKSILKQKTKDLVEQYKNEGREQEIQEALKQLNEDYQPCTLPDELCYLTGNDREHYLHDMAICQRYACLNRKMIAEIILGQLFNKSLDDFKHFETIHNYIDHEYNLIRKGAVSAKLNETLLIPINMRDGSLICVGKGNKDWNYSAPHGAGRLFSRNKAKEAFSMEEFKEQMKGIYTSTVNESTLDECPMAYKSMKDIVDNIGDTVDIIKVIKPIYNFKASE